MQSEFVSFQSLMQAIGDRQAAFGGIVQALREELIVIAPLVLGVIHRGIGGAHQRVGVFAVIRIQADADAAGEMQVMLLHDEGFADRVEHLGGDPNGVVTPGESRQVDDEFIASQPRHAVALAQAILQAPADHAQQAIADLMAERIVDVLEVV